jgi:RimJ/RimL family protein N-acetyltransferase
MAAEPRLDTDRLALTPLALTDLDEHARASGRPEDAERDTGLAAAHWRDHDFGHWAIRDQVNDTFLGAAELHYAGEGIDGIAADEVEAGWWVTEERRGEGIATEAMRAAIDDVWTRAGVDRIAAYIDAENVASQRVASKLRFAVRGPGRGRSGEPMTVYELRRPLVSPRLLLTPLTEDDLADYAALRGDPRTRIHSRSGVPVPFEQARTELLASCASWRERDLGVWRIGDPDGSFLGVIVMRPDGNDVTGVEIGWVLTPEAWGDGIATEAASLAVADLLERSDTRITAYLQAANAASRRVAEKVGLQLRERGLDSRGVLVEAWETGRPR